MEKGATAIVSRLHIIRGSANYFFRLLGDWFVGFNETPSSLAFERTEFSVRPSFKPITLVGVFSLANSRSCFTSVLVHSLPVFLVYFGIAPPIR